jgi:hypothetical protein
MLGADLPAVERLPKKADIANRSNQKGTLWIVGADT